MKLKIKGTGLLKALLCVSLLTAYGTQTSAQTLTLDSCLALARKHNADIRTSQLEVLKAQEVKRQAFTKYFPQLQLGAFGYYAAEPLIRFGLEDIQSNDMRELLELIYEIAETSTDVKKELTLMKKGASVSGTVVQPIFVGGRIVNGNRLAKLGVEAAELQATAKMRDVMENIESSYYLVTGLQQKVATLEAALNLIDSLDHTVDVALANGLVTKADALQVQLKRNEMLANQQMLTSGIRLSKRLLCQQIGIEYSDDIVFEEPSSPSLPPLNFNKTLQPDSLRPEMQLLRINVEAEKLKKKMTIGEQLPQIAFIGIGFYGNIIKTDPSANGIAMLSLQVPLTAWWENAHKIHQHNIAIEEAQIMRDNYTNLMSLEEEKAYSDMVDAYMLMKSDSSALEVAQENYRLANLNYEAGNATLSEVLQAHALLLQAENAITDRRTTYVVARRRLLDLREN
jgi:outer membrane protein TolC